MRSHIWRHKEVLRECKTNEIRCKELEADLLEFQPDLRDIRAISYIVVLTVSFETSSTPQSKHKNIVFVNYLLK